MDEPIVAAWLGACIRPCCYEFGAADLAAVAAGVHAGVADVSGRTTLGFAGSRRAGSSAMPRWHSHGVEVTQLAGCTGCDFDGYSHRVRNERERHVVAVWQTGVPAAQGSRP